MPYDPLDHPINQPRRRDRQVEDEDWIKDFLRRAPTGVLATVYEGQPFTHTNLFVYDEATNALYLHTNKEGRTRLNVEAGGRACYTVSEMGRLLPASEALEFSVEYASVVVFGQMRVLDDPAEAERGLQMLLDKYFPHLRPGEHYRPIQPEELKRTAVFRLDIESWSGKQKKVGEHPGAFRYGEIPGP